MRQASANGTTLWERVLGRLRRLRPGSGHPVHEGALDREYASGAWDHFASPAEAPRYLTIAGMIASHGARPRVLDIGCGSGQLAAAVRAAGPCCYLGVDLSAAGLQRARRLDLPAFEFVHADFESWRPDGRWDVIVFNETVGYARRPSRLLLEFGAFLAPDGVLLVSLFRSGNQRPIWRAILRDWHVASAQVVAGPAGHVWDIRTLRRTRT